ncbi:MAG: restriction endonuclease [Candidatus Heimdallarchaeota archaeon]|nr:MAG: restriction endonuclease [Candidatus Heimdallarchaeota archaeon]
MKNNYQLLGLEELTLEYCRQRNLIVDRNFHPHGDNQIDLIIQNGDENEGIGVMIKDWKRAVGVDIVIRAEKIMKNSRFLSKMLIVTNLFSDPARSLAERIRIFLLTRNDLIRILSSGIKTTAIDDNSDSQNVMLY